jgi:PAS domain S-box-containing protein
MTIQPADLSAADGFAHLFEEMYDAAVLFETESGQILAANAAFRTLLQYDVDDLSGLTPSDIHPHEIPRLKDFLQAVHANGRWVADDLSCRAKDGRRVPAEIRASAMTVFGTTCILAVIRDLRAERLAALGQAVRKVTHDLRNTLSATQIFCDRLAEHGDPNVRRSAETIMRSVERAVGMCRQALRAGTASEHVPDRVRFCLADVVDEVAETAAIRVSNPEGGDVVLDADFDQMFRIFQNLVRNAADAGAQTVTVRAGRRNGGTLVELSDDGPGLADAVRDRVFDEKPDLSASGGTGLGLAIARELARNHGGDLTLGATGSTGTAFHLAIPDP